MNRINVPIKKVGEKTTFVKTMTGAHFTLLFVLMMSSVLLGAFAQGRYAFLRFPNVSPESQLGAVAVSLPALPANTPPATTAQENSAKLSDASSSPVATNVTLDAPLIVADTNASLTRIDDLSALILEHADAILQLNLELELIKNRSVSLIVEFDQNCGNWKDECATPYATELETNNSRYSQLIAKLASFNQELAKAQRERSALTQ